MIPNILTTARVAMVPLFAYFMLIENNPYAGALIFVLAGDRKSTRLNSSHGAKSRMPSSA